ncbi:MAG: response regulator [Deltaproteobacteria bacterium]|nr:response regulator [Deltaproteobacteria bacterium]
MTEKIKVLMVDDEAEFRRTTKKILEKRGFITILAESGEEAIEKLADLPDVVVLDIKMSGMDGHEALQVIKKRKPDLPVIMLSGHGTMSSAKEALAEGAFDYLAKPCDIEILSRKILEAIAQQKNGELIEKDKVKYIMIPISEYTIVNGDMSVKEAIEALKETFSSKSTTRIMETGHRSVLVLDDQSEVEGFLTIKDLMKALMPGYLKAPKPSMADSVVYSPMFWTGMFEAEMKMIYKKKVREIMSPVPRSINAEANIMETAYMMLNNNVRRLIVEDKSKVVGIVREQDLFFEMERILRSY